MRQRSLIKLVAWMHLQGRPYLDPDLKADRKNTTKSIKGVNQARGRLRERPWQSSFKVKQCNSLLWKMYTDPL